LQGEVQIVYSLVQCIFSLYNYSYIYTLSHDVYFVHLFPFYILVIIGNFGLRD